MQTPDIKPEVADGANVPEIFADHVGMAILNANLARVELQVMRFSTDAKRKITAQYHPVCRLVLSPVAAAELHSQLQQMVGVLKKAGALKEIGPGSNVAQ